MKFFKLFAHKVLRRNSEYQFNAIYPGPSAAHRNFFNGYFKIKGIRHGRRIKVSSNPNTIWSIKDDLLVKNKDESLRDYFLRDRFNSYSFLLPYIKDPAIKDAIYESEKMALWDHLPESIVIREFWNLVEIAERTIKYFVLSYKQRKLK